MPKVTEERRKLVRTERFRPTQDQQYGLPQKQLTQMRRDFLSAAEEQAKTEGYATQRVGSGSYEEVRVFSVTTVQVEAQQRGTCQACGRSIAVQGGLMVLHGYRRPGHGWTEGRCLGTDNKPANLTTKLTRAIITDLAKQEATWQPETDTLRKQIDDNVTLRGEEYSKLLKAYSHARNMWLGAKEYREHLEQTALPALGTKLQWVKRS